MEYLILMFIDMFNWQKNIKLLKLYLEHFVITLLIIYL